MERIRDAIQKARRAREGESVFEEELPESPRHGTSARPDLEESWLAIPQFEPDNKHFRKNRIITLVCEDPVYTSFDIMRTKLLATMKQKGWRSLAITSPNPHCGKTLVSANLAFSFARQKEIRSILVDIDLRRPQLAKTLGLKPGPSVASFLSGFGEITSQFVRFDKNLAIGASTNAQKHSAELLANSQTRKSIDTLCDQLQPDIIIYDMPPLMASDDTLAFLPNVDCTLLVVEAEKTTIHEVDETEQTLAEKSNLLGVVLNKCRFSSENYGYYYD